MFFKPAIDILRKQKNNEVLCTSRQYREANELSKIKGLDLLIVGRHGGADLRNKLYESTARVMELSKIIHKFSPDLAVSFSSPEASRVSFGLGIDHLGFNDSPHAEAVARLSVPLLTKLFSPSIIPISSWTKYGISPKRIIRYGGLDPVAWLLPRKSIGDGTTTASSFHQYDDDDADGKNTGILEKLKTDRSKKSILIRLEESKAAYIANKRLVTQPIALVDFIVKHFGEKCNIIILCRYSDQINEISGRYKNKAIVLTDVVDGVDLLKNIDVFIGAGGTMTTESALLGRPTISIAPVHFYIDDYLKRTGLIKRAFTASRLVSLVNLFLNDREQCELLEKKARKMLSEMEDPVEKLVSYIDTITTPTATANAAPTASTNPDA
jgi:predicted glycosyltransferase